MLGLSGNAGRKTFLVIEEVCLDYFDGCRIEDEDDSAEGSCNSMRKSCPAPSYEDGFRFGCYSGLQGRATSLLALVDGDEDILIKLLSRFKVPGFVPLKGNELASRLTGQDKLNAGTVTPEIRLTKPRSSMSSRAIWTLELCGWKIGMSWPGT